MDDMKIGASGGEGGDAVETYVIPAGARIREVHVTCGWFVDSIRVVYADAAGEAHTLPAVGGHGLHEHQFVLEADEYLIGISGSSGKYVDSIVFHTNRRVSPAYGGRGGENEYLFLAPESSEVVGFFGRAGWYVDAIGIVTRALPQAQAAAATVNVGEKVATLSAETRADTAIDPAIPAAPAKSTRRAKVQESVAVPAAPADAAPAKPKKGKNAPDPVVPAAPADTAPVKPKKGKKAPDPAIPVAPVETAPVAADDLQLIEGIGPKIAELLAQNGIVTFAALASTSPDRLRELLLAAGRRYAVADPKSWPAQAELAARGDTEGLNALKASLRAGRKPS